MNEFARRQSRCADSVPPGFTASSKDLKSGKRVFGAEMHAGNDIEDMGRGRTKGNWRTWLAIACLILSLGAIYFFPRRSPPATPTASHDAATVFKVSAAPLHSSLTLAGIIEPGATSVIVAPYDGVVQNVRVPFGTRVTAGDVLAVMESTELETHLRDARAAVLKATMSLDVLKKWDMSPEVVRAKHNLEVSEALVAAQDRQVNDAKMLFDKGIIERKEYDGLVQQRDSQRMTLIGARQDLASILEKGSDNNMAIAEFEVENAKVRLSDLQQQFAGTTIRASADGILLNPPSSEQLNLRSPVVGRGTRVSRGTPLFAIADTKTLLVTSKVDEMDINKLHVGQEALIESDAIGTTRIEGKIVSVSAEALRELNTREPSFYVKTAFSESNDKPESRIRLGMSARVQVHLEENHPVIIVPFGAVQDISSFWSTIAIPTPCGSNR